MIILIFFIKMNKKGTKLNVVLISMKVYILQKYSRKWIRLGGYLRETFFQIHLI